MFRYYPVQGLCLLSLQPGLLGINAHYTSGTLYFYVRVPPLKAIQLA